MARKGRNSLRMRTMGAGLSIVLFVAEERMHRSPDARETRSFLILTELTFPRQSSRSALTNYFVHYYPAISLVKLTLIRFFTRFRSHASRFSSSENRLRNSTITFTFSRLYIIYISFFSYFPLTTLLTSEIRLYTLRFVEDFHFDAREEILRYVAIV